ncbi:phage tail protein [Bradyrhizobium sp. 2TAF24]|uniref:phage tail protein n=1 Tax=Bradyrhizobium sp. 2TAF24 TaxID=3233011 RepID=UPI003F8E9C2A
MSDQYVGEIRLFGFPRIPDGWLACNGQSLSIANYDVLYALIGTTYGGDGVQTFNVPDLRGRVPISQGTGPGGLSPRVLGQVGGQETHTLLDQEMPSHSHGLMSSTTVATFQTPGPTVHLATSNSSLHNLYVPQANVAGYDLMAPSVVINGSSFPHNNMMPTLTANFCIAYVGIYPSQG